MILIESQTRLIAIKVKIMIIMKKSLRPRKRERERERESVELVSSDITKFISQQWQDKGELLLM